ncbi:Tetratricopeptide repeat protein 1 [Podospora australis]|uniref:Tetratricopeptide repeat protein 1 n=1 Tax=Podospora australis TaxID=1536484 RepID=A0AAN6X0Q0_9PEZI|nr:Tetratricopeptide repeat protein 1 [Podospora australis]
MAASDEKPPAAGLENKSGEKNEDGDDIVKQEKFSPEEEAEMLADSNTHKTEANILFTSGKYDLAINKYDEAVAVCPNYLDYELAVLRSNISACNLKLEEWKEAVKNATSALDSLDRVEQKEKEQDAQTKPKDGDSDVEEVETVSAGAAKAGPPIREDDPAEAARRKRQDDIARIRAKALMRRARGRSELGGWSNLEGAIEDYKRLSGMTNLSPADKRLVQAQLRALPPRAKAAQEKETAEMWAKLKDLGNGILKPFGLSTDAFKMVKDEKTGGYSMNFSGGGSSGKS